MSSNKWDDTALPYDLTPGRAALAKAMADAMDKAFLEWLGKYSVSAELLRAGEYDLREVSFHRGSGQKIYVLSRGTDVISAAVMNVESNRPGGVSLHLRELSTEEAEKMIQLKEKLNAG
jgi:hypothetical protein